MNDQIKAKIAENRERAYATVRALSPEAYRTAVAIGHIPLFIEDKDRAAAEVEAGVMALIAQLLEGTL